MVTRVSGTTSLGPVSGPVSAPSSNYITQSTATTNIQNTTVNVGVTGTNAINVNGRNTVVSSIRNVGNAVVPNVNGDSYLSLIHI